MQYTKESLKNHKIYKMSFARVYPLYLTKVVKKGRNKKEVDQVIFWLTGYDEKELDNIIEKNINFEDFFKNAPKLNPLRSLITGNICGIRVEDIPESLMKEIRYLDKLIDELAKGKEMDVILRKKS